MKHILMSQAEFRPEEKPKGIFSNRLKTSTTGKGYNQL